MKPPLTPLIGQTPLHWLMRMGGRPATSTHTGAGEPVEVYGAGVSVAAGLLLRAVRHEALLIRMEVGDLRRLAVVAAG